MTVATATSTTAYAERVLSGDIPAGQLVRLACERHLRDLKDGHLHGLRFDERAADHAIQFFSFLRHSKGEWAGSEFRLSPWQEFIVGSLFGWKKADGTRRFRTAYNEIARKNGKSTLSAGIGLYLAFFDDEPGAEVYAAATKRDQAKIVWGEARRMVQNTPALRSRIKAFVANLHIEGTASKFEPLGADADSMDGLNIHGAIVDELHAHKSRAVVDVLETATGARRQPLLFYITTAGYDRTSVCWELRDYAVRVLEGHIRDDGLFAFIATIDPGDDWTDEAVWYKANPNLGISVKIDDLRGKCERAKKIPGQQNSFKRLHLDVWTEQAERWLDLTAWDACGAEPAIAIGQECFCGLDLSSTTDITAFVAVFPPEDRDGPWDVMARFWIPGDNIREKSERDRAPYDVWVDQGWITATDGNITDYDVLRAEIRDFGMDYQIREIPYDPWNATQLATQLGSDGATVVPLSQGYSVMSEPAKYLESLILSGRLRHGNNPVLRWMAANVAVQHGPNDSIRPTKAKSTGRIDGIVALVMGIGRAMVHLQEPPAKGTRVFIPGVNL